MGQYNKKQSSVSFYFYAGDFADAIRRYEQGIQQIYQTHNEVAALIKDLLKAGHSVNIYSFVTPQHGEARPYDGLNIVNLGANSYSAGHLLKSAVAADNSDFTIAHIANAELLTAVAYKNTRAIAMLANSYNRTGIKAWLEKRRIANLLNNDRFELVSNHCMPATEQLARMGVSKEKLIAWDIRHPFDPSTKPAKQLRVRGDDFNAVYVGSIAESKGIGDLIRAIALLRQQSLKIHCTLAGGGDIELMKSLGRSLGVSDLLHFLGLIGNQDVFQMMANADLVVVPSRSAYPEGFPLTMFEAIASRTPIVCSDHPMFRPIMINGRSASVYPSGDYKALALAMRETLTDAAKYSALSANASVTWENLKGPADWRTLILKWVTEGRNCPWIRRHMLSIVN